MHFQSFSTASASGQLLCAFHFTVRVFGDSFGSVYIFIRLQEPLIFLPKSG